MINELMKRLSELPNVTMDDGQEYIQLYDAMETVKRALEQEPRYCDRNICLRNEYNNIGCDECEVTKSKEPCEDVISRQAVMDCFKKWQPYMATRLWDFEKELSALPSVKPQSCEDAISRSEAITAIEEKAKRIKNVDTLNGLAGAVGVLFNLPSVNPQEKTGHWLMTGEIDVYYDLPSYECSKCGQTSLEEGDYCPNCGARMVEEQERSEV